MFPLSRFRVADDSMRPTLLPGDYVLVNRWAFRRRAPVAGEIVVLRHPHNSSHFLVKRIASVAGPDTVFVVGDNEARSEDSRQFGPVARGLIVGKVWIAAKR